jgi:nitrogen regulatory protein PII
MKLIAIIFDSDKEEHLHEILNNCGVTGFTTWGPVYGKGAHTDPRMGTQIWPGENQMLIAAIPENIATILKQALSEDPDMNAGVKAFEFETTLLV